MLQKPNLQYYDVKKQKTGEDLFLDINIFFLMGRGAGEQKMDMTKNKKKPSKFRRKFVELQNRVFDRSISIELWPAV